MSGFLKKGKTRTKYNFTSPLSRLLKVQQQTHVKGRVNEDDMPLK